MKSSSSSENMGRTALNSVKKQLLETPNKVASNYSRPVTSTKLTRSSKKHKSKSIISRYPSSLHSRTLIISQSKDLSNDTYEVRVINIPAKLKKTSSIWQIPSTPFYSFQEVTHTITLGYH